MPYRWIITYDVDEEEQVKVCNSLEKTVDVVSSLKVDTGLAETLEVRLEVCTEDGSHHMFCLPRDIDVIYSYQNETETEVLERLVEENPVFAMLWHSPVFFN